MNRQHIKTISFLAGITIFGSFFLSGCGVPDGSAEDGKKWYGMHNCSACHGKKGNDGRAVDIAGIDMGFSRFERILRRTDAPIMPHFSKSEISQQDAADIYLYLKSTKP